MNNEASARGDQFSNRWAEPLPVAAAASASARSGPGCSRRRYLLAPSRRDHNSTQVQAGLAGYRCRCSYSVLVVAGRPARHRHWRRSSCASSRCNSCPLSWLATLSPPCCPSRLLTHARPTIWRPTYASSRGFGRAGRAPELCACTETGIAIATAVMMAMPLNKCFMRLFSAAVLLDDTPGGR